MMAENAGAHVTYKPRECFNHTGISKVKFSTKSEAKSALKRMNYKTYKGKPMQRDSRIYRCSVCDYYHIGHKQ